jgi:hypothetical protein
MSEEGQICTDYLQRLSLDVVNGAPCDGVEVQEPKIVEDGLVLSDASIKQDTPVGQYHCRVAFPLWNGVDLFYLAPKVFAFGETKLEQVVGGLG